MPSKLRRPADVALPPEGWNSIRASFDLTGLTAPEASGVLLQWALSRHVGAEIVRAGYPTKKDFATRNSLSIDRVRNFFNGHRRANFEDLAYFIEVLGPEAWPDPERLAAYIDGARRRSEDSALEGPFPSLYRHDGPGAHRSGG